MKESISILIIYTGGTIGMVNDPVTGSLVPIAFSHISDQVPELRDGQDGILGTRDLIHSLKTGPAYSYGRNTTGSRKYFA